MKILHTSDWHIGHKIFGQQRTREFAAFFHWLTLLIEKQNIDALIVAGDIFDSQTPSNSSLELYYSFLSSVSRSSCRHIVITGGNHDSPALLEAPRTLLRSLNIHVIAKAQENLEDELIVLKNIDGIPELIVLAVPYLRDREIRSTDPGESSERKQQKLIKGIYAHYAALCELAEEKQKSLNVKLPIIATGHLFCRGGKTRQGDGVRELYIGNLIQIGLDCFPDSIDYLALGHLHSPQLVGRQDNRRYSGSPVAMTFEEAESKKIVIQVDSTNKQTITEITVPCFQNMCRIVGKIDDILTMIKNLAAKNESIFLQIDYSGDLLIDNLQEQIYFAVEGTQLKVLRIQNKQRYNHVLQSNTVIKTLDELTPVQVFLQCLEDHQIPEKQQKEMLIDFAEIMELLAEHSSDSKSTK